MPASASAQEGRLKLPTFAASAAAAGDWVSTYHALKFYKLREANPILRPFDDSPAHVVWLGAAMDVGGITAWNLSVGRSHPRVAASGLWAMTAFRAYLAVHNMRNERRVARR
jgi:hypothetical protein